MAEVSSSQKILIVILLLSAGYLAYDILVVGDGRTRDTVITAAEKIIPESLKHNKEPEPKAPKKLPPEQVKNNSEPELTRHYASVWGRDPFVGKHINVVTTENGLVEEEETVSNEPIAIDDYEISAISFKGSHPFILVNETILGIGDELEGMKLISATSNSALLEREGQQYILKLKRISD